MSHISKCETQYKSLAEVKVAADVLGFLFMEDQKEHAWYGRMVGDSAEGRATAAEFGIENLGKCDHALRLKDHKQGDYEVGVVRRDDGTFALVYDSWGPGERLERAAGKGLVRFKQEYGIAVTQARVEKTLARQGFKMTRENIGGGRVRVRLQRRAT
jgi:hypothetical protein